MEKDNLTSNGRRRFLGKLTTGAAAMSIAGLITPLQQLHANPIDSLNDGDPDEWFKKIKGKHRIIFDVTEPHPEPSLPFAWPRVFLITNEATGTPAKDINVVMVLRHNGIPYAFENRIWAKYNFGEVFKINDPATGKPSVRNAYWKPEKGAFKVPGVGEVQIGINELQDSGVMFCVCDVAMTVYSAVIAEGMKMNAAEVKKDWVSGLLPGIQVVPSGIWAVGRAQERGCTYCFAG